jgi:DMSO/TMAO reductase YedYZ molybdopterin-dependent catalytic subunit
VRLHWVIGRRGSRFEPDHTAKTDYNGVSDGGRSDQPWRGGKARAQVRAAASRLQGRLWAWRDAYRLLTRNTLARGFVDWKVRVDGMVEHPMTLSLADLKTMPMHSQITEVACEEGWSYIAEWIGTPLSNVLNEAALKPGAKYIYYRAFDPSLWETIDMDDAMHPQTLLTVGMNDSDLPVRFGGPLRLRVPRQLGYKSQKFVTHITAVDSVKNIGIVLGSPDPEYEYSWFAGI